VSAPATSVREVEETGDVITAQRLNQMFRDGYLNRSEATLITHEVSSDDSQLSPLQVEFAKALERVSGSQASTTLTLGDYGIETREHDTRVTASVRSVNEIVVSMSGDGQGTTEAFVDALEKHSRSPLRCATTPKSRCARARTQSRLLTWRSGSETPSSTPWLTTRTS
jgi:hypothetical protein